MRVRRSPFSHRLGRKLVKRRRLETSSRAGASLSLGGFETNETLFLGTTLLSGLLVFTVSGFPQDRDEDRYHGEHRDEGYWRGRLFDRVRADIDHVQAITPTFSGDE